MFLFNGANALIDGIGATIAAMIHGLVLWLAHVTRFMPPEQAALIYGFTTGMVAGLPIGGMALLATMKVGESRYRSALIISGAVCLCDFIIAAICMGVLHVFHISVVVIPDWVRHLSAVVIVGIAIKVWWDAKKEDPMRDPGQELLYFGMAFGMTLWHPGGWITYLAAYGVLLPSFGMLPLAQMGWGETFLQLLANSMGLVSMWAAFLCVILLVKFVAKPALQMVVGFFFKEKHLVENGLFNWFSRVQWRMQLTRISSYVMALGAVAMWNLQI